MTINELQSALIEEIEVLSRNMGLMNKRGEPADLKGYSQAIPVFPLYQNVPFAMDETTEGDFPEEPDLFPYFIVRVDGVEYQKKREDEGYSDQAHVIIAFAVYDEDQEMKGYFTLNALMERVVMRFQKNPALGPFYCERKMNTAYQEDDTYPQFFGAVEMTWNLPEIEMEAF